MQREVAFKLKSAVEMEVHQAQDVYDRMRGWGWGTQEE